MVKIIKRKEFYEKEGRKTQRLKSKSFWKRRYHKKRIDIIRNIIAYRKNNNKFIITLDAGCGTGEISNFVKDYSETVISLDLSSSYLTRTKKINKILVQADLEMLPFKTQTFDFLV